MEIYYTKEQIKQYIEENDGIVKMDLGDTPLHVLIEALDESGYMLSERRDENPFEDNWPEYNLNGPDLDFWAFIFSPDGYTGIILIVHYIMAIYKLKPYSFNRYENHLSMVLLDKDNKISIALSKQDPENLRLDLIVYDKNDQEILYNESERLNSRQYGHLVDLMRENADLILNKLTNTE